MTPRFTVLLLLLTAILLTGCATDTRALSHISLDFPHGSLRLLVQRHGESRLFYAAAPTARTIKPGTFDIDTLARQLTPRLHEITSSEARPPQQPYGIVTLGFQDGTKKEYRFTDAAFAEDLLTTACANLETDAESPADLITEACTTVDTIAP